MNATGRILAWFSCGAASAVAAKIARERYGERVEVLYCDTSADEHPDNARFMADVERWIGCPVKRLQHPKYKTVADVFMGERYIVGPMGAVCTRRMKRELREKYQRPDDTHVFGLTADEAKRISDFEERHGELQCLWLLAKAGITKTDCYRVLSAAGIELPAMYKLGYKNNNCIGCVKGGMGYWNKIRRDFPKVFEERAKIEREIGASIIRRDGERIFLDQLPPDAGNYGDEPDIECGIFCSHYSTLVDLAVSAKGCEV
jgi:3'-phosphoadenosine 5'-phosphosulfate sulfotransferase (PAPS reductase)/FAD synthetase